jgi:hypothetical protein
MAMHGEAARAVRVHLLIEIPLPRLVVPGIGSRAPAGDGVQGTIPCAPHFAIASMEPALPHVATSDPEVRGSGASCLPGNGTRASAIPEADRRDRPVRGPSAPITIDTGTIPAHERRAFFVDVSAPNQI